MFWINLNRLIWYLIPSHHPRIYIKNDTDCHIQDKEYGSRTDRKEIHSIYNSHHQVCGASIEVPTVWFDEYIEWS